MLAEWWKLIRELKNSEVTEVHVIFLKRYHEGVFKQLFGKRNETEKENNKAGRKPTFINIDVTDYCSLEKLWDIGQETNKIERKTRELALTALIEIL